MRLLNFKNFLYLSLVVLLVWGGQRTYQYFNDHIGPQLTITGFNPDGYCAGEITCQVQSQDDYGVARLAVWLDDQLVLEQAPRFSRKYLQCVLPLNSLALSDGAHQLKVQACDAAYHANAVQTELTFYVDNQTLEATLMMPVTTKSVLQGRVLPLQIKANKPIKTAIVSALGQKYQFTPASADQLTYEAWVPVDCEEVAGEYSFTVQVTDYVQQQVTLTGKFQVLAAPFKKQSLGVDPVKFAEEQQLGLPQSDLETELARLTAASPAHKLWRGPFILPLTNDQITCEFGVGRTTQERGWYRHKAIDLAGTPRCVVWAPQSGQVVIKARYAATGNTVVIDHGLGLLTLLCHLEEFANLQVGDRIKQGNPVGTLGKTGYATGYHLHWEMRLQGVHVDPWQWLQLTF